MSALDERLQSAVHDLRGEVDDLQTPPFTPNRSATPLVFALVMLLGIGAVGYVARSRPDDAGGISVATQPEAPDTPPVEQLPPVPDEAGPDGQPAGEATRVASTRQITVAADGEVFVPIPGAPAWSAGESWLLLYRTGTLAGGHVVVDLATPDSEPIDLPFTPPDIEQVYWHPTNDDELFYAEGDSVFSFDVATSETRLVRQFAECDTVESGVMPVPIAADGSLSLLCLTGSTVTQVVYDLDAETERRGETASDTAAHPSPSGNYLVRWNTDGSATVLNRELQDTGVVLDLESNVFSFVVDGAGNEWVAASLFDGPAIGTVVLLPLDGIAEPVVVIGPDRGDEYPPSGNLIASAGSRIAVSTRGVTPGLIAGTINVVDVGESLLDSARLSIPHRSEGRVDFWSNPFVSLSPSGRALAFSSDRGSGAIDTFVTTIVSLPE